MQNFRFIGVMVSEFRFFKEEDEEEEEHGQSVKIMYFIPPVIFSSDFLLVVTFSHVLYLDVLRRQIEIESEN